MKRLFVAVKINPDKAFFQTFRELRMSLSHEKIKWVEEYNIHITLKFFGETEEMRIPEITKVLESLASQINIFSISLSGLGIFGSRYNPRVIWTGIQPYRYLAGMIGRIHSGMTTIGFPVDRQNLVPHLTLGRVNQIGDKGGFQVLIDRYRKIESISMVIDHFILFESILMKEGPNYFNLKTFDFRKK